MRYAHLFWKLFGLPLSGWDDLLYDDFWWMKPVADEYVRQREAASHG